MALDLDEELRAAIAAAELLYGPRDQTFELLPVSYHRKNYAQSVVDDVARTISVKLADPIQFADKESEAKYELWHEAVHCLAPVNRMDTLWFEEGVALRFGLVHAPLSSSQQSANRGAIKPPWNLVLHAFTRLNPKDSQIKTVREQTDHKQFDTVTKQLIINICGASPRLAATLCRRLPRGTR